MAEALKVLAQSIPAATTLTDAYTVPSLSSAAISSIVACNQDSSSTSVRISVAVAGAVDALKQYLYYDALVLGNDSLVATIGITLGAADVVRVRSANGWVSFTFFGAEES